MGPVHAELVLFAICALLATRARAETRDITPLPNGNFESVPVVWSQVSTHDVGKFPLIVTAADLPPGVTPFDGVRLAWLGGFPSDVSSIRQTVTVPAPAPKLGGSYWIQSDETECTLDRLVIRVNASTVSTVGLCAATETTGYAQRLVDLAAFAGQSVLLTIEVSTDVTLNSNVFVDAFFFETASALVFANGFE